MKGFKFDIAFNNNWRKVRLLLLLQSQVDFLVGWLVCLFVVVVDDVVVMSINLTDD